MDFSHKSQVKAEEVFYWQHTAANSFLAETDVLAWLGHDASPILRRGKMPRNIEDGTVSIYINGLKDGARYRESGLVHCQISGSSR
ncbi:MAG: hypothetical protein ACI845_003631 [Gammaproteobacteria bacterium]